MVKLCYSQYVRGEGGDGKIVLQLVCKIANIAHDTCKAASKSLYTQACSFTPISYTGVAMVGFQMLETYL